jgi:hypothetical protein
LSKLDEIGWYINRLSFDLKAEQILAFLEESINLREIIVTHEGQLQRVWSKDVAGALVESLANGRDFLNVRLNRDGIYDALPETLFHDLTGSDCSSGADMAKESMRLRTEEKESRLFFKPLENEIFLQKVKLADMENRLFESIFTDKLMGLISDFWKLEDNLPGKYISLLTRLLPFAHLITGDKVLTRLSLEFIIDEKVELKECFSDESGFLPDHVTASGKIGECDLGANSILGEYVNGYPISYRFIIGPVKNMLTSQYVKNGTMERFLRCFFNYFIPVYIDANATFVLSYEQSLLVLDDENDINVSYLGYNSVIE